MRLFMLGVVFDGFKRKRKLFMGRERKFEYKNLKEM